MISHMSTAEETEGTEVELRVTYRYRITNDLVRREQAYGSTDLVECAMVDVDTEDLSMLTEMIDIVDAVIVLPDGTEVRR